MSSPSPTSTSPRRPRRESRFTEGSYTTSSPTLSLSPNPNISTPPSYLSTILSEQDSYEERQRRRGNSSSSTDTDSLSSSTGNGNGGSPTSGSSPVSPKDGNGVQIKEGVSRRSITFGRGSVDVRWSLDERPRAEMGLSGGAMGGVAMKVKGRLRALTGERRKDVVKPYPGT